MKFYFVLINHSKKEYVTYGKKIGEGQTVKGIHNLMFILNWNQTDDIYLTEYKNLTCKEKKEYAQCFVIPEEQ